jgi:hypothetical protein
LSLTLREEHRLKVFDNRVLRMICGPKRENVTGDGEGEKDESMNRKIGRQQQ